MINGVNIIDGNQYLVENTNNTTEVSESTFDEVFQEQTGELSLDEIFEKASRETGVDVSLLKAVAQAESGFDTNATSYCGAMGIMQLMPATAEGLGIDDPYDAEQNIMGGAKTLSWLLDAYNGNVTLALAGYNAGYGSVQKYGGVPPYGETLGYIDKINGILGGALDNDSTTIEGAGSTDLSRVSSESAPDVAVKGNSDAHGEQLGLTDNAGKVSGPEGNITVNSTSSNDTVFNYEDYIHFLNTYSDIADKLAEAMKGESTYKEESTAQKLVVNVNQFNEDAEASVTSALLSDEDGKLQYNSNLANAVMLQNSNAVVDNLFKSNAQSMYEAQATVISPLVAQMLND